MVRKCMLLLGGICSALLIVEVLIRLALPQSDRFYTDDPNSLHLQAGKRGVWYGQHPYQREFAVPVTINSHGFRDRERSLEKPDGAFRVAVIGDSFVEAMQVPFENSFMQILQRKLSEHFQRPVEILSFGRSGLGASQKRALAKESLAYDPDAVLVALNATDLNDVFAMLGQKHNSAGAYPREYSHAARLLWRSLRFSPWTAYVEQAVLTIPEEDRLTTAIDEVEREVSMLKQELAGSGVVLYVFFDPLTIVRKYCEKQDNVVARIKERLLSLSVSVYVMDTQVCGEHSEQDPVHFPLDRHWTSKGHAVAARELFSFLVASGSVRFDD